MRKKNFIGWIVFFSFAVIICSSALVYAQTTGGDKINLDYKKTLIAFLWGNKLMTVDGNGQNPKILAEPKRGNITSFTWSPDGTKLMYHIFFGYDSSISGQFRLLDIKTRKDVELPLVRDFCYSFSPTTNQLVCSSVNGLFLVGAQGIGRQKIFTLPAKTTVRDVYGWSANGEIIYFQIYTKDGPRYFRIRKDGSDRKEVNFKTVLAGTLTEGIATRNRIMGKEFNSGGIADDYWSLNSTIYFSDNNDNIQQLLIEDAPTGGAPHSLDGHLSPDGTKIAYIHLNEDGTKSELWLYEIGSGKNNAVSVPFSVDAIRPSWSPDGLNLVYGADNGWVEILPSDEERRSAIQNSGKGAWQMIKGSVPLWQPYMSKQSLKERLAKDVVEGVLYKELPKEIKQNLGFSASEAKRAVYAEASLITKASAFAIALSNGISTLSGVAIGGASNKEALQVAIMKTTGKEIIKTKGGQVAADIFDAANNTVLVTKVYQVAQGVKTAAAASAVMTKVVAWVLNEEMKYINSHLDEGLKDIWDLNSFSGERLKLYIVFIDAPNKDGKSYRGVKYYYYNDQQMQHINFYTNLVIAEVKFTAAETAQAKQTKPAAPATETKPSLSIKGTLTDHEKMYGSRGVVVSGNYAYVVSQLTNYLTVVDISDPSSPKIAAWAEDAAKLYSGGDVKISGNYAYITSVAKNVFTVVDISNPLSPKVVGSVKDNKKLDGPIQMHVAGKYAYVSAGRSNNLAVIDISNPVSPAIVASISDANQLKGASELAVSGNYVYVEAHDPDRLAVIDISNPLSPAIVGSVKLTESITGGIAISGNYAYLGASDCLAVVDISNPSSPAVISSIRDAAQFNSVSTVFASGNYVYATSYWNNNFVAVDISNPRSPKIVSSVIVKPMAAGYGIFVSSNYAYIPTTEGLIIVQITPGKAAATPPPAGAVDNENWEYPLADKQDWVVEPNLLSSIAEHSKDSHDPDWSSCSKSSAFVVLWKNSDVAPWYEAQAKKYGWKLEKKESDKWTTPYLRFSKGDKTLWVITNVFTEVHYMVGLCWK